LCDSPLRWEELTRTTVPPKFLLHTPHVESNPVIRPTASLDLRSWNIYVHEDLPALPLMFQTSSRKNLPSGNYLTLFTVAPVIPPPTPIAQDHLVLTSTIADKKVRQHHLAIIAAWIHSLQGPLTAVANYSATKHFLTILP
jgi:hypothetical protein